MLVRRQGATYRCQLHAVGFFSDVKIASAEQWRHKDQSTTGAQILYRLVSSLPTQQGSEVDFSSRFTAAAAWEQFTCKQTKVDRCHLVYPVFIEQLWLPY